MAWKMSELFDRVWDYLIPDNDTVKVEEGGADELVEAVEKARSEWLAAKAYFDSVTDPDLVDHAIYSVEAAERKYMFLLKQASALGYGIAPPADASIRATGASLGREDTISRAADVSLPAAEISEGQAPSAAQA